VSPRPAGTFVEQRLIWLFRARVAAIKQNGHFPCPNCLIAKKQLKDMGTDSDIVFRIKNPRLDDDENRQMISKALKDVQKGYAVTGDVVNVHLKPRSLLPIQVRRPYISGYPNSPQPTMNNQNAFSSSLAQLGFDIYQALVVDPLHEFEIGVWKGLYLHLLRLLDALGKGNDLVDKVDER
jgi:hypothetical protein